MSAQTPLPKDDPLMVAWEAHKATEQHANDVRWAKVEAHTVGSLWSAFEAGWRAREAALSAAGWVVEQGWRTIETAPRDQWLYVWHAGHRWLRIGSRFRTFGPRWYFSGNFPGPAQYTDGDDAPTHWRPLPAAPQEDQR